MSRELTLLLIMVTVLSMVGAAAEPPDVPRFSQMVIGESIVGWRALKPAPNAADTRYRLVNDGGTLVVEANADHSMSGLVAPIKADVRQFPLLRWRWKITAPLKIADMTTKAGDDYAVRVYVLFDYPAEKLSLFTRMKLTAAEMAFGIHIPTAALNYVWDNQHAVGTLRPNAYTDRAQMIVVESGASKAGTWQTETRDLAADFRAAFNEEPPPVVAVALATDTDNTGETTTAWYGDFEFLPRDSVMH